ncbi:hypothetical protein XCR_1619 [Xanthomonas campestris pv. raphani 756C]|nr:hypothetical protein XCR_1619 [Xanthomonas campestris pv. raphani 756C]
MRFGFAFGEEVRWRLRRQCHAWVTAVIAVAVDVFCSDGHGRPAVQGSDLQCTRRE